jgi:hypothetical protein
MKEKVDELEMYSENKNIRNIYFFNWLLQSLCGPFAFLNGLLDPHRHLVGLLGRGISPT